MRRDLLIAVTALVAAAPLRAQRLEPATYTSVPIALARDSAAGDIAAGLRGIGRHPWIQPLVSLALPGAGQLIGGHDRGLLYLAAEVWLATRAVALTREGHRGRRAFEDLAFEVARTPFSATDRPGSWDYYESMTHYVESGTYDLDPGGAFQPETDTLTFNGSTWLLARRTFFVNPDSTPDTASAPYKAALSFYKGRAVLPAFQWSWRNARLEQDVYKTEIRSSDDAFRAATNYLGALVLNHLTSAIDALITIRLSNSVGPLPVIPRIYPSAEPGALNVVWSGHF